MIELTEITRLDMAVALSIIPIVVNRHSAVTQAMISMRWCLNLSILIGFSFEKDDADDPICMNDDANEFAGIYSVVMIQAGLELNLVKIHLIYCF